MRVAVPDAWELIGKDVANTGLSIRLMAAQKVLVEGGGAGNRGEEDNDDAMDGR